MNEGSNTLQGAYLSAADRTAAGPRPTDTVGGFQLNGFASDNTGAGFTGGAGSRISMGVYSPVLGGGARTILAWIKPSESGAGAVITYGNNSAGQNHLIWKRPGDIMWSANHSKGVQTTDSVPTNEWTFFATTILENGLGWDTLVYFNGQLAASENHCNSNLAINTGQTMTFEIGQYAGSNDFIGVIDEVATFDKALTSQQIASLFNAATGIPEPSTFGMAALGLLGLALGRKRRSR